MSDDSTETQEPYVLVTITRSAGTDGAVLVMIDTNFEPDASDGSPGLRVLINDADVSQTVMYARDPEDDARSPIAPERQLGVSLKDLQYNNDTQETP